MEKIAIISDVHGNITALNVVFEDIEKRGIKRIFCLGDCIGKCANPDLVVDIIREKCEIVLIGNIDYVMCRPEAKDKNYWTRNKIGEERANYLFNLPISYEFYLSGHLIRLFHASPYGLEYIFNPMFSNENSRYRDVEIDDVSKLFNNTDFIGKSKTDDIPNIVGYGHLHTPFVFRKGNKTLFNTGSVGVPVEMLNKDKYDDENKFTTLASYVILEGKYDSKDISGISFNICRVPYNIEKEIEYLKNTNMYNKEKTIESLKTGISNI